MTEPHRESGLPEPPASVTGDENSEILPKADAPVVPDLISGDLSQVLARRLNSLGQDVLDQMSGQNAIGSPRSDSERRPLGRGASPEAKIAEHLDEIADDMLSLVRRVRGLEETQQAVLARLEQLPEGWSQAAGSIAREVNTLRRDLLGDRRHSAAESLFYELIPMVDRLRMMHAHLDLQRDDRMKSQLDAVLETLSSCLRRLGCDAFDPPAGSRFDPERMECAGYLAGGEPDIVLELVRCGYICGQSVMRPAAVLIAAPRPSPSGLRGDDSHE